MLEDAVAFLAEFRGGHSYILKYLGDFSVLKHPVTLYDLH